MAFATSENDFEAKARVAASVLELDVVEIEDCEPMEERVRRQGIPRQTLELARMSNLVERIFTTFHTWDSDESDSEDSASAADS